MRQKHIYGNVTPMSEIDEAPGSGKRFHHLVVSLSVLLFLSLMGNSLLTYFYVKLKCPSDAHALPEQDGNYSAGERIRRCSAGERQIQYKDRLYIFPTDEMSWISSRVKCQELGGDLVIINSQEEHKFLVGAMNTFINSLHWIGLRNVENQGRWLWVDETLLMQNLSWWKDIGVDHESEREDCVGYYDGQWVDMPCSTSERRICEITCTH
ncbi:perlucin-like protein isoform X1 [Tachysurus vachellii]|uniref:perlucin-like protein isoform X1 n=2 Tax=Tachysurus vachellii TaxID=175792 RepID=UPI00296B3B7F|nr:perlucin-like protein isoform X1 [Tachysurus vachellii]